MSTDELAYETLDFEQRWELNTEYIICKWIGVLVIKKSIKGNSNSELETGHTQTMLATNLTRVMAT